MKKLHRWSCLTAAFAWVAGFDEAKVHHYLGHDGGQVIDPNAEDPAGRKGFHIQELTMLCLQLGSSLTPFQLVPQSLVNGRTVPVGRFDERIKIAGQNLKLSRGIVIAKTTLGYDHALGFNGGEVMNPDNGDTFVIDIDDNLKMFRQFQDRLNTIGLQPRELWIYA